MRVSPGRCFIFVMKYIKLTYTQARIMFISFVSFRCLSEEMQWGRVEAAGPPCRSGGCSRSDMATARSAYSKLFSHNANKTHCKQTLLERAGGTDRGRVHARAISHLRAGDLSPVSLCRRDKEGLPPRFASQAHVLFLRRKEQSPTLKSQRAKNRHKCMNGLLVQPSERTNPPVADTKKGAGEDSEAA